MSMKETMGKMDSLMDLMKEDMDKADTNKSAAARVRKNSLAFAKVAKDFRSESVAFHKK